ncbi:DUF3793 family protein [Crassaminicella profunda]|uniref:DUF3793 family protein n=1 Tax=Crassaminicella profunda TaxID=1286698 RepID=UPI001CA6E45E|nr:DUF3793 family protein [Crassaminicella profunda]QZY55367.1 DUF3793 family protein [Crassaminicella profunda]
MLQKEKNPICFQQSNDEFIKWLVQILGPVILGAKPSEILSFPSHDKTLNEKINKINHYFGNCKKISFKIFHFNHKSTKILFYKPVSLDGVLRDFKNAKFLKSIGYPKEYNLELYLNHMIEKIIQGTIPDEIGLFLGYPLKDVLGFMGHPSLKLTKVNGWRVYGDATLSDKTYDEFLKAKAQIKNLLTFCSMHKILSYA